MSEIRQAIIHFGRVVEINQWDNPVGIPCGPEVEIGWAYVEGQFLDIPQVPFSITPRQARVFLALQPSPHPEFADLLEMIEAQIQRMQGAEGRVARLTWEYATEILRTDPLVAQMGQLIGMTDKQLDEMFIFAASL